MHRPCWILAALALAGAILARADEPPRRTSRVASGPVHPAPSPEPPRTAPAARPALTPSVARPTAARPSLLEPSHVVQGHADRIVARFEVRADAASAWELVVTEVGGPVAQIFAGQGPPPATVAWDGRLLDGGLAWSEVTYTYDLASVDSLGVVARTPGAPFTLPAYTREEPAGVSFLLPGRLLVPGRRGDPVDAARAHLASAATRLNQDPGRTVVRIEVLARDEDAALVLGEAVRTAPPICSTPSTDPSISSWARRWPRRRRARFSYDGPAERPAS
ncbi:MAG: hypothetical protein R3D98_04725 [Candidatus Krumholzibacteriia bacterium]